MDNQFVLCRVSRTKISGENETAVFREQIEEYYKWYCVPGLEANPVVQFTKDGEEAHKFPSFTHAATVRGGDARMHNWEIRQWPLQKRE
jgi:hypothetical protein